MTSGVVWSARPEHPAIAPALPGSLEGVDVQLTSSPRRALGLLAAGTIGLSTALLGVATVAHAAPGDTVVPAEEVAAGRQRNGISTELLCTTQRCGPVASRLDPAGC